MLDSKSLQVMQHLLGRGEPRRLTSFIDALESIDNVQVRFSGGLPLNSPHYPQWMRRLLSRMSRLTPRLFTSMCHAIEAPDLAGCDLLIIATRWSLTPYSNDEIALIKGFVEGGGGLWLMANHSRVPGTRLGDFTTQDARLAAALGIELLDGCFQLPGGLCELACPMGSTHPIIRGSSGAEQIKTVCINNGTLISVRGVEPLILADSRMIDKGPFGLYSDRHAFAVAKRLGDGRILATGDSGFVCEPSVRGTGPGLLDQHDNLRFVTNSAKWLLESS